MNKVNAASRLIEAAPKKPTSKNFRVSVKDEAKEKAEKKDKGYHVAQKGSDWCIIGDESGHCYEKLSSHEMANAMLSIYKKM